MNLFQFTAPDSEPVSLEEAKLHCRVDGTDDDAYISSLIIVARSYVENFTGRSLVEQVWELGLDGFDSQEILLPKSPISEIESITYIDLGGAEQEFEDYTLDTRSQPARLRPAYGKSWPSTRDEMNAVVIQYTAGYGDAGDVPAGIKQAMLLIIGHFNENREAVVLGTTVFKLPLAVDALLMPYRIRELA